RRRRPATSATPDGTTCADEVVAEMMDAGFDPLMERVGPSATIAFAHCPFREMAEAFPELVCHLHRGMVEGMVEVLGGAEVTRFATLVDRDPCRVELVTR
ncbi:MAG: hypothetical protein ACRDZW_03345, partial [Acidimicrobiales bacterium]